MDAKLLKTTKFPPEFAKKVDMTKVNIEVMKKWIAERISEILGNEDDVVIELCFNLLEGSRFPNIKHLQINLTGFLEKDTAKFCKDLWNLCLSAQDSPQGVPKELLEAKKLELMQEQVSFWLPRKKHAAGKKPSRPENGTWREFGGGRERIVAVAEEAVVVLRAELIGMTAEILPRLIDGDEAHRSTELHLLAGERTSTFPAVVEAIDEMIIEGAARRDSPLPRHPGHHHALSRQFWTVGGTGGLREEGGGVRPAALAHLTEVAVTVTVTVAGNEPAARLTMTTPGPQAVRRPEEDGGDPLEAKALSLLPLLVTGPRDPVVHLHHDLRRGQVARVIGEVGALRGDPLCTNKGPDVMYLELILLKIAEVTTTAGLAAAVAAAAVAIEPEAGVEAAEDTAEDSGRPAAGHRRAAHAAAAAAAVAGGGINLLKDMPQLDAGRARTVLPLHHLLKSDRE
ncbi:Serine/arginine repetitive matrix protein [Trichophyton interdigitale]|uniref:Serine/arginine repetitive matrix protein n=1 Tax=Trichophyton interdigitale TaxID=101480 RepID=A0A9P4YN76_9EURO|nr:Serine/arginine repetitive matrix protein [Trichophyton interdigitale]KAF3899550.1 Serine/arginine repetitive matrix protein [Trichophyton interdigitale]KAG8210967.1 Serine/arginine repetitive matrix protein [Trichophyton interdigitale]